VQRRSHGFFVFSGASAYSDPADLIISQRIAI